MSHSKENDEQSNSSNINSDDEESTSVVNENVAEKTDAQKDSDESGSNSQDSLWFEKKQDMNLKVSEKRKQIIEASRKRFREEMSKVIQKISPAFTSLLTEQFKSDVSNTAASAENVEEEKKEGEDESNEVPEKKQKK